MSVALFGREMAEFANFTRAIMSLFRALVGDFDYAEMASNNRAIAFTFMALFMVTMFLIMLNMLVAIVMDVYADTKAQLDNSESVWEECWEISYRSWQNLRGQRMPFNKILDKYAESRGVEKPNSIKLLKVNQFVDMVEGLMEDQALDIFMTATSDWLSMNHRQVELPEVLSTASMAAECAKEVAEELDCRVRHVKRVERTKSNHGEAHEKPPSSEDLANDDDLSLEDIFRAAQLRLEQELADKEEHTIQVDALRRILASCALLSADRSGGKAAKPAHVPGLDLSI